MRHALLGLLAETSVHPGTGRGMGVVDLPVAREAATDYPVLVGSSLKGALKDKAIHDESFGAQAEQRFGGPNQAGDLLISDGRLLLLPVRSLTKSYFWATCPHILERLRRDQLRAGLGTNLKVPDEIKPGQVLSIGNGKLTLEERQFEIYDSPSDDIAEAVEQLILHEDTQKRLRERIAVLHDDDFAWFARYGLSVQARNVLEKGTKKSQNLWYEEALPPDTVMYAIIAGRNAQAVQSLRALFPPDDPYLQAGGNETVGQGWFAVKLNESVSPAEHS